MTAWIIGGVLAGLLIAAFFACVILSAGDGTSTVEDDWCDSSGRY